MTSTSADWDREGREKRKDREAAKREKEKRRRGVGASGKPGFSGWKAEKRLAIPVRRPAWPLQATPPGLNRSIAYPGSLQGGFQRPASARKAPAGAGPRSGGVAAPGQPGLYGRHGSAVHDVCSWTAEGLFAMIRPW